MELSRIHIFRSPTYYLTIWILLDLFLALLLVSGIMTHELVGGGGREGGISTTLAETYPNFIAE